MYNWMTNSYIFIVLCRTLSVTFLKGGAVQFKNFTQWKEQYFLYGKYWKGTTQAIAAPWAYPIEEVCAYYYYYESIVWGSYVVPRLNVYALTSCGVDEYNVCVVGFLQTCINQIRLFTSWDRPLTSSSKRYDSASNWGPSEPVFRRWQRADRVNLPLDQLTSPYLNPSNIFNPGVGLWIFG